MVKSLIISNFLLLFILFIQVLVRSIIHLFWLYFGHFWIKAFLRKAKTKSLINIQVFFVVKKLIIFNFFIEISTSTMSNFKFWLQVVFLFENSVINSWPSPQFLRLSQLFYSLFVLSSIKSICGDIIGQIFCYSVDQIFFSAYTFCFRRRSSQCWQLKLSYIKNLLDVFVLGA